MRNFTPDGILSAEGFRLHRKGLLTEIGHNAAFMPTPADIVADGLDSLPTPVREFLAFRRKADKAIAAAPKALEDCTLLRIKACEEHLLFMALMVREETVVLCPVLPHSALNDTFAGPWDAQISDDRPIIGANTDILLTIREVMSLADVRQHTEVVGVLDESIRDDVYHLFAASQGIAAARDPATNPVRGHADNLTTGEAANVRRWAEEMADRLEAGDACKILPFQDESTPAF